MGSAFHVSESNQLPAASLSSDCELYGLLAGLVGEMDWFSIEF